MASKKAQTSEKSNTVAVSEYLDTAQAYAKPEITDKVRRQVWKRLGTKSIRDIAADTGLKPEQVIEVKQQLLDEVDVLTFAEQRMKLMVTLHEIVELAKDRAEESIDPRNHAGMINAATNAVEKTLKQIRMLEKEDTSKVEQLNALRVRELLSLMTAVVSSGCDEVSETYGVDREELEAVFTDRLVTEARNREIGKM